MAGSVNKAVLIGNLGRDPEARNMQSGGKVVSFSVATSEVAAQPGARTDWPCSVARMA
jgi:single-stranded DNA-binding protein